MKKMFKMFKKKTFTIKGNNNIQINGRCIRNGNEIIEFGKERHIQVIIEGNCKNLETMSGDIEVRGNVEGYVKTSSGDVEVGSDIKGNVKTSSGDVEVGGNVSGSCNTNSGDIDIENR